MFSRGKREFFRKIGCTEAEIQAKERRAVITKARPDSPLTEAIWRLAASDRPINSPIADAAKAILAKQTKALAAPPHAPIVSRLMQRAAGLN